MAGAALVRMIVQGPAALLQFQKLQHGLVERCGADSFSRTAMLGAHDALADARRNITAQQVKFARMVLEAARDWIVHSRWSPLILRVATVALASASAAGGWVLASYLFSGKRLRAAAAVAHSAVGGGSWHRAAHASANYAKQASDELPSVSHDLAPVILNAKPERESVAENSKERDGPSPVFEAEEDELEHRPEDVVDTRTAIRSVRNSAC